MTEIFSKFYQTDQRMCTFKFNIQITKCVLIPDSLLPEFVQIPLLLAITNGETEPDKYGAIDIGIGISIRCNEMFNWHFLMLNIGIVIRTHDRMNVFTSILNYAYIIHK